MVQSHFAIREVIKNPCQRLFNRTKVAGLQPPLLGAWRIRTGPVLRDAGAAHWGRSLSHFSRAERQASQASETRFRLTLTVDIDGSLVIEFAAFAIPLLGSMLTVRVREPSCYQLPGVDDLCVGDGTRPHCGKTPENQRATGIQLAPVHKLADGKCFVITGLIMARRTAVLWRKCGERRFRPGGHTVWGG